MKTVFITGGRGFIGRNLGEALAQSGYRVLAPSSSELNLLDQQAVDAFMRRQRVDIIVHAANKGGGRDTMHMQDVVHSNLRMFFNIIKHSDSVEKIIHFGSGAEYGKHKQIVMVEENEAGIALPLDDYGFYKSVCSRYIEQSGSNIVNLRIFACYGKYEDYRYKFISNAIVKNLLGMPIHIRQNVLFDYVYVDDLIKMVLWSIEFDPKQHVYNITRGDGIELVALAEMINMVAEKPSEIIVDTLGMNLEYTSSNHRIIEECPVIFTPHQEAISHLYDYYEERLARLDLDAVRGDRFIDHIMVKK
ncbi:MAG: NAD-dependent epimerase/dehydratase family protein [Chlorobaculum sp.]|jgi:GDP-L-fucose synthase|nr:NAD-dependent epimerase/dehydratase family protein [Chlorobaculum sp.]